MHGFVIHVVLVVVVVMVMAAAPLVLPSHTQTQTQLHCMQLLGTCKSNQVPLDLVELARRRRGRSVAGSLWHLFALLIPMRRSLRSAVHATKRRPPVYSSSC